MIRMKGNSIATPFLPRSGSFLAIGSVSLQSGLVLRS